MSARLNEARTMSASVGPIVLAFLCAACAPEESYGPCEINTDQEIIDAAIGYSVTQAIQRQDLIKSGECNNPGRPVGAPCINIEPYFSIGEFKEKNPDCCTVLKEIDGETSDEIRPYIRGEKQPKVYQVKMRYTRFYYENGKSVSDVHMPVVEVDCRGNVLWGSLPRP